MKTHVIFFVLYSWRLCSVIDTDNEQRNYWRVKTTYINFTSAALKDIEENQRSLKYTFLVCISEKCSIFCFPKSQSDVHFYQISVQYSVEVKTMIILSVIQ